MDILGYHIPGMIGVGAAFTSVYAAFAKFDADQSDKNREFVRDWLLGLKVDDRRWAQFFKELFTEVFGERHLSAKCVGRSALLSAALFAVIWTYWYFKVARGNLGVSRLVDPGIWTMCAVVADYFSLWKTRVLLTRSNLVANGLTAIAVVVGDALATIIIFLAITLGIQLILFLILVFSWDTDEALTAVMLIVAQVFSIFVLSWPSSLDGSERMLFLAPLLTSAWLWVYLIAAYGMRASNHFPSWLRPLSKVMDFEYHPVRTIGYVAATVSAVIVGIITLV